MIVNRIHKGLVTAVFLLLATLSGRAQFLDGSSGFLQTPTADMNPSGTFMITNNYLNKHTVNGIYWGYDTFGYAIDITFWSRLEVCYSMTLFDGKRRENPSFRDMITFNQDRHFSAKFLFLKENEFGWNWVPAIAAGIVDPTTGGALDYTEADVSLGGNGFFNRYYVVATKHFNTPLGEFGVHAGYQYSKRIDFPIHGPCGAINWRPKWLQNDWIKMNLIGEYDARTWNAGVILSVYKDHFDLMFELQNMQWISFGARYKLVLF